MQKEPTKQIIYTLFWQPAGAAFRRREQNMKKERERQREREEIQSSEPIKKKFILSLQWERFFPLLPTPVRSVHPAAPGWAPCHCCCVPASAPAWSAGDAAAPVLTTINTVFCSFMFKNFRGFYPQPFKCGPRLVSHTAAGITTSHVKSRSHRSFKRPRGKQGVTVHVDISGRVCGISLQL